MDYTFYVGITVVSTANYNSLSEPQRAQARSLLLQDVKPVAEVMGTYATETPEQLIREKVAAIASGEWKVGGVLSSGVHYYYDFTEHCWVCVRTYQVNRAGVPYVAKVNVGGTEIESTFAIYQTAKNP